MGLFERFRRTNQQTGPMYAQLIMPTVATIHGMSASQLYNQQPALRAVVDFISRNVAQLPLKVYRREGEDRIRERDTDIALLIAHPNDNLTTYEMIDRLMHDLKLYGWGLWYVVPSAETKSGWTIDPIPVSWIRNTPTYDGFEPYQYEVYNPSTGYSTTLPAADCIRFAAYNPASPVLPVSPVEPLKEVLAEQVSAWRFRNQVWANGGRTTAFITRPQGVDWSPEARNRFVDSMKENYSGNTGPKAGGMPLLEDGMEIKSIGFNAREAEWSQATQLSREDVAAVYHVNPAMVWANDGQTYASVKENARSLYVDCLGPDLRMIQDRINQFLLPKIGAADGTYAEFDLQAKLNGSFEEQVDALSKALGGAPYMTIADVRAIMNLPHRDGTDEFLLPLNMVSVNDVSNINGSNNGTSKMATGGILPAQPTSQDVSPVLGNKAPDTHEKENGGSDETTLVISGEPDAEDIEAIQAALVKFFRRQSVSVLNQIDRAKDKGTLYKATDTETETPTRSWFDTDRWNKEFAEDLQPLLEQISESTIQQILEELDIDPADVDLDYGSDYIPDYVKTLAEQMNSTTLEELIRAIEDPDSFADADALKSTARGVFENAMENRATSGGTSVANNIRGWDEIAAIHCAGYGKYTTKTWRTTSRNPRPEHAKMNGETIVYENPDWCTDPTDSDHYLKPGCGEHMHFSNGCRWPGDFNRNPKQVAGCKCRMDLTVKKKRKR